MGGPRAPRPWRTPPARRPSGRSPSPGREQRGRYDGGRRDTVLAGEAENVLTSGELTLDNYADVRGRGSLGREYPVTYRPAFEPNEQITDGTARPGTPRPDGSQQEVSIEQGIHERFRINVGDIMRFDIAGRPLEARVASVRRVRWEDSRSGGFMFVFRPGPLQRAPHTYIATLHAPEDPAARARFQRDLQRRCAWFGP